MCFCETNPPFFDEFFFVIDYTRSICNGKRLENSVGSFSKTNPPGGCFGCLTGKNLVVLDVFGGLLMTPRERFCHLVTTKDACPLRSGSVGKGRDSSLRSE